MAQFRMKEGDKKTDPQEITLQGRAERVHGTAKIQSEDKPPKFELVLTDMQGVEQKRIPVKMGQSDRFDVGVDLPSADDRYTMSIENAENVSDVDVFVE